MHRLLERQVRQQLGEVADLPEQFQKLLKVISQTYTDFDKDRKMAERSLDISSREMHEINQRLQAQIADSEERAAELEKMNSLMVGREIRMINLKEELERVKQELARMEN